MIFIKSISSTPAELNNLVPLIGTKVLIGTDSGCFSKFDNAIKKLNLSSLDSPMPIIPPEQTFTPASLTLSSVSILS